MAYLKGKNKQTQQKLINNYFREHKKKIFFTALIFSLVFCSCKKNILIFDIGDSREEVISTIVNDFTVEGKHMSKEDFLEKENGNHITLYDCIYKGQEYYKVRVYYDYEKIRRLEFKIDKDKITDLLGKLESQTGTSPHHTTLYYIFGII